MANTFGDLTYNQKTLKPIGRPVNDLKDLYAKKGEDYNYVIDSLNATETALNAIPYEDKDKAIVDAAKTKYQELQVLEQRFQPIVIKSAQSIEHTIIQRPRKYFFRINWIKALNLPSTESAIVCQIHT